ncbi:hypothetical protein LTR10_017001 [Elasticomyces elasticus]|uniref:Uncharacterized protein n=1 Tax=Exophiala sideris TaxID=1016849 RepID=A0ABR0JFB8_9EURO|nr:hypothetical protein LTR10_017001 [Elasticomyces elasticus]KAK5025255.1 hypothetical protein LTS07_008106 [Exophiala sideris]KAK5029197.1 hypothetical protein LTR13_008734 [Exophiala sideris]KAK5063314.1 hypothetical protein LTR69_004020 [Exophiala sideris]KAK5179030.1 hypothetical protein LTR44_008519 [Eurotiomycetes sp. CCFEE 6388]
MPTGYSYSVLQCNANNGSFCCRAGGDETNCCNDTASSFQADVTIGQILLPGTNETVNTTYSTVIQNPSKDNTAVVGGVLGGVLGAALMASLLALWYILRSRRSLKHNYISLQNERDTALQQGASEKAALQHQIEQQQLQYQQFQHQQMQAPTYSPGSGQYHTYFAPSPALPMQPYPTEVSSIPRPVEMDAMRGASELSDETAPREVERIEEKPKRTD